VAVTDGERQAAVVARMSRSHLASLEAHGEDHISHLIGRLNGIAGNFPNDGNRYENVLLHDPIVL
jgi:hypothetical protein